MSETEKTKRPFWKNPIAWAIIATGLVAAFGFWAGGLEACGVDFWGNRSCSGTKWSAFLEATPNEVGDTLAGFAGALAFVWLIATVVLQGQELREQRLEFEKMANAQEAQANVLKTQADIFVKEQSQRDEARAEQLFEEKLRSFIVSLVESPSRGLCWAFSNGTIDDEGYSYGEVHSYSLSSEKYENQTIDEAIINFRRRLPSIRETLWDFLHQSVDYRLPPKEKFVSNLVSDLESIVAIKCKLSEPQQVRLSRMRLPEIIDQLQKLGATSALWTEDSQ